MVSSTQEPRTAPTSAAPAASGRWGTRTPGLRPGSSSKPTTGWPATYLATLATNPSCPTTRTTSSGAKAKLLNRTPDRAGRLAAELEGPVAAVPWSERAAALDGAALLVNTTTLGMAGQPPLVLALDALPRTALVTDVVYTPLMTPLLAVARAHGNPVVDGLGMLLHQARPGFRAWFGPIPRSTRTSARWSWRRPAASVSRWSSSASPARSRWASRPRPGGSARSSVPVFDADAAVHRLLGPGGAAVAAVAEAFPACGGTARSTAGSSAGWRSATRPRSRAWRRSSIRWCGTRSGAFLRGRGGAPAARGARHPAAVRDRGGAPGGCGRGGERARLPAARSVRCGARA